MTWNARTVAMLMSALAVGGLATACSLSSPPPVGAPPVTTGRHNLAFAVDDEGFPVIDRADLPAMGRIVFPELAGMPVEEANAWAQVTGWPLIQLIDLGDDEEVFYSMEGRPPSERITISHADGTVLEAYAG